MPHDNLRDRFNIPKGEPTVKPHRKEFLGGDVPRNGPREESDVKAFSTEYLVDAARIARRELVDQARI